MGVPLERGSQRTQAATQGCDRHNETIPHRNGRHKGSPSVTLSSQREQATVEPEGNYIWGTNQPLPQPRITAFVQVSPQSKPVIYQELDRTELVWPSCRRHEDHADSR